MTLPPFDDTPKPPVTYTVPQDQPGPTLAQIAAAGNALQPGGGTAIYDSLIAADGTPIDAVRDDRFNGLPFVVGEGANARVAEFGALLAAAGELRDRVRAGVLVGGRRWTLQMESGVEVQLPELDALDTLKRLADIERQSRILEKDVISIDLRIPGRITARLTEDAAAQRAAMLAKRPKHKVDPA